MSDSENKGDLVSPRIFVSQDGADYWFGDEADAPESYRPIGWIKDGEERLYINDRELEIVQHHGKPPQLHQSDSLDGNSTKSDIMPVINEFLDELDEDAYPTMLELDHYIENRGYDPAGEFRWVGNQDPNVIFWMGDEEYIKAVLDCDNLDFSHIFNQKSKYTKHAQELDRSNPVMRYQVAKRYGEYDYKRTKWRPITIYPKDR